MEPKESNKSTGSNESMETSKSKESNDTKESIQNVMKDLEYKYNPKSISEGLAMLNNGDKLMNTLQNGAAEFESRVGRPMTYSEMRSMWG